MAKPCERCRRIRYQITLVFGMLILINFIVRYVLNLDTKTIYDLLLFPSSIVIIFSIYIVFFNKRKVK